jgi:hypothetical protein
MFLEDIAARLVSQGVGTIVGSTRTIFISSKAVIPEGAGPYISIRDTGGTGSTWTQDKAGPATRRPTAQIVTRASGYGVARAKAEQAYAALNGVWGQTINSVSYISITARQEPTDIGLDDEGRIMLSFNIDAEKAP